MKNNPNQKLFILILFSICVSSSVFCSNKRKRADSSEEDGKLTKKAKKNEANNPQVNSNENDSVEEMLNMVDFPKMSGKKYQKLVTAQKSDFGDIVFPLSNHQIELCSNFKPFGWGNLISAGPLIIYPVLSDSIAYGQKLFNTFLNNPNWLLIFFVSDPQMNRIEDLSSLLWDPKTVPLENNQDTFVSPKAREFLNSLRINHRLIHEKLLSTIINFLVVRKNPVQVPKSTTAPLETVVTIAENLFPIKVNPNSSKAADLGLSPSFQSFLERIAREFDRDPKYDQYRNLFTKENK